LAGGAAGDLGTGWRLLTREIDLQTNVPPTGREGLGVYAPFRDGTRLYLSTPTGERVGFTFVPVRVELPGVVYYRPAWQADPGVGYSLASVDALLTKAGARYYDQASGQPYNPASPFFAGTD